MFVELGAVVGSDGFNAPAVFEREQVFHHHFGYIDGHFPVVEIADYREQRAALHQRAFEVLALRVGQQVQLPVAEA